jgi:hypothetical protein
MRARHDSPPAWHLCARKTTNTGIIAPQRPPSRRDPLAPLNAAVRGHASWPRNAPRHAGGDHGRGAGFVVWAWAWVWACLDGPPSPDPRSTASSPRASPTPPTTSASGQPASQPKLSAARCSPAACARIYAARHATPKPCPLPLLRLSSPSLAPPRAYKGQRRFIHTCWLPRQAMGCGGSPFPPTQMGWVAICATNVTHSGQRQPWRAGIGFSARNYSSLPCAQWRLPGS